MLIFLKEHGDILFISLHAGGWMVEKKTGIRNEVAILNSPGQGIELTKWARGGGLPRFLRSPASTRERAPQKSKMALDYRTERVFRDETPSNRLQAGYLFILQIQWKQYPQ